MIRDSESGAQKPFNFDNLYQYIPVLQNFNFHIDVISFHPLIDSSNVKPPFWVELAETIQEHYEAYDGFVVLHGTDTMSYSASMLSFLLENLNKPVVFTGSQLPLGMVRTDGRENFINSIEIAAACEEDTPIVPEVCICFENKLFRGNRTSKFNTDNFKAFLSGNYPLLAEIGVKIRYHKNYIARPNFRSLKVHRNIDTHVALLKLYPGINAQFVESVIHTPDLKAIVLETFGAGNAPTDAWFLEALSRAIDKGIIIFDVTQCKGGTVEMGMYETSLGLEKIGVIGGYDITTEAAICKMMFLLGNGVPKEKMKALLQNPLRGEITKQN